jgi:predicted dehydrogenase
MLLTTPACPVVTLQLNYLDRSSRRTLIVNTDDHTLEADLVAGTLMVDRDRESFTVERDDTYRSMHAAILSSDTGLLCRAEEALETMRLIEATQLAAAKGEWVKNE